jgi:hypothetical protein
MSTGISLWSEVVDYIDPGSSVAASEAVREQADPRSSVYRGPSERIALNTP